MKKSEILTLYEYNYWANERVLRAAARVTPDQYEAPAEISHGSLRGALVHTYAAELVWRLRCQEGLSPKALPGEAKFPTLEALVRRWREEGALMRPISSRCATMTWLRRYDTRRPKGSRMRISCGTCWSMWSITAPSSGPKRPWS